MADFVLFAIPLALLEKIITKTDEKSYFRLQQTCHKMEGLIHKSRNITVVSDDCYDVKFDEYGSCLVQPTTYDEWISIEEFYGIRMDQCDPNSFLDDPESLCDALKKYRITCRKLIIGEYDWTSEDCLALLHTLKPIEIHLASEGSTQFEALFHSKTLKKVEVSVDPEYAQAAAPYLLSTFEVVELHVTVRSDPIPLLRSFLQTLNREPLPNLEKFHATIFVIQNLPTKEELEEQLCDFNLTVKEDDEGDEDCDMEDADLEFTIDSCCRVVLRKGMYIDVLYYKTS